MSTLHLVFSKEGLARAKALANEHDEYVLLSNAVLAQERDALALEEDVSVRGLERPNLINYTQLVELCTTHDKVASWP